MGILDIKVNLLDYAPKIFTEKCQPLEIALVEDMLRRKTAEIQAGVQGLENKMKDM